MEIYLTNFLANPSSEKKSLVKHLLVLLTETIKYTKGQNGRTKLAHD